MKPSTFKNAGIIAIFIGMLIVVASCSTQIQLTSSWTNKNAKVKSSPKIMVMVYGKDLANRQLVENYVVAELQKKGQTAIAALDVFKPEAQNYDSATMVSMLRQNNIDMLLTNAVVNVTEKERYIPGTTEQVPVGSYATPYNPNYYQGYYYNNYYSSNYYYQTIYETRSTPGYTVTDVEVIIESKLYDVNTPELLWFGQSKSYTKEPSTALFNEFARMVVADISKNNLLVK
ncbi:MAG TPA: hypothetical protein PKD91_02590 [Bacteroidia bacterium]|mgnify:CR=1 FL=1|nr:hypothetical protein [Bacteroidia bacterium]